MKNFINHNLKNQPSGFYVILYTEICELFGRFGISALLVLYLTSTLKFTDTHAFSVFGTFTALLFLIPLLGGMYADKYLGYKKAISIGIILMAAGNFILSLPYALALYSGLSIIAVGSGFFLPALTALLSHLYPKDSAHRDNAFVLYYIAKNIGALLATVICSLIGQRYGYPYAFLCSAFVMASGFLVFTFGNKNLAHAYTKQAAPRVRPQFTGNFLDYGLFFVLAIFSYIIIAKEFENTLLYLCLLISGGIYFKLYLKASTEERRNLISILIALAAMILFAMLLAQGATTLNLFIDRIINRQIGNYTIPPSMFYALDPFFMIVFSALVLGLLKKMDNHNPLQSSFKKISLGLLILAFGFGIFILAGLSFMHTHVKPGISYVIFAYMLFPIAELAIMPITVSLMTRLAPHGKEALFVSFYLLGQGLAGVLVGVFSKLGQVNFPLHTLEQLLAADHIYTYVFALSAGLLLLSGLVCYLYQLCACKKLESRHGLAIPS